MAWRMSTGLRQRRDTAAAKIVNVPSDWLWNIAKRYPGSTMPTPHRMRFKRSPIRSKGVKEGDQVNEKAVAADTSSLMCHR